MVVLPFRLIAKHILRQVWLESSLVLVPAVLDQLFVSIPMDHEYRPEYGRQYRAHLEKRQLKRRTLTFEEWADGELDLHRHHILGKRKVKEEQLDMAREKYIPEHVMKGFDSYKYSSMDTSPFSNYIMHPFWNAFVKLIPLWFPANGLTFIGFLLLPLNFFVLAYYDLDFTRSSSIPAIVWLMCAFNNFMSHTLDGIDGKQARRTNTSSALGELFDHGLDAWSTTFFAIAIYDIFGQGEWGAPPLRFLLVIMAIQCTFVFSHWEKYNTGILYLPWGYDIALVGMTILYLLTFLFGVEFWQFRIHYAGYSPTIGNVLEAFLYLSNYMASTPVCIFNVLMSYQNKSGKMRSLKESLRPLLPVAILFPLMYLWAAYSPSRIIDNHPRCYYTLSSALFANITSRMILNQMTNTRADAFNWLLVPLIIITPTIFWFNLGIGEAYLLYAYTALAVATHVDYGIHVVKEIAEYLNIYVFSVEKPPPKSKSQ